MRVQLYTRPECHLCEEAKLVLQLTQSDIDIEIEEINIESTDALLETYMMRIPVIEQEGVVIQEGIIDYPTVLEGLQQRK
ncbi:glutaredoxin family protein [Paenisporosarcina cavernae]|uniref:Glutaredoxin family protein n=1 Tax=Paenisporosarcina cavernae TaxID=2320858 RepID=A0A385YTW3_9BACL|nr:glutaredoxin family protein [Paenisporosarcina cavernae]AYC30106.1 glutaredoxin family protein [Paenisporosarcina cavernae]